MRAHARARRARRRGGARASSRACARTARTHLLGECAARPTLRARRRSVPLRSSQESKRKSRRGCVSSLRGSQIMPPTSKKTTTGISWCMRQAQPRASVRSNTRSSSVGTIARREMIRLNGISRRHTNWRMVSSRHTVRTTRTIPCRRNTDVRVAHRWCIVNAWYFASAGNLSQNGAGSTRATSPRACALSPSLIAIGTCWIGAST